MISKTIIIAIVLLMFIAMFLEIKHPSLIAFTALIIFFILGYITTPDIMRMVSNEGVLTLALLFLITSVIERTNVIDSLLQKILKKTNSGKGALASITFPLIGMSAFFNNTPIVIMMVSSLQDWCNKKNINASKLLLSVSYATIFGGMFTIIGTSTNLVVHGWLVEKELRGFTFFELAPYAALGSIFGVIYLLSIGYKLLPENKTTIENRYNDGRKFLYEAEIKKDCVLINKTVTSKEFQKLDGVYLLKIIREKENISPVNLTEKIQEKDILVFTGTLEGLEKIGEIKNLLIKTSADISINSLETDDSKLIEGVVSHDASMLHRKIKYSDFRTKYDASIVAVHRNNESINKNVGEVIVKPGDVLLMLAGERFEELAYKNNDFYTLTNLPKRKLLSRNQVILSISGFIAMITIVTLGIVSMFEAALILTTLFLLFNLFDKEKMRETMHFQVLLLIVSSLGIGFVIESSGTADLIANTIIHLVAESFGVIGLLVSVYLVTNILTEIVTNTAAAVIVLPIAIKIAEFISIEPTMLAIVVAIAASASFSTPIGYQTNLIVYGPGGYKFSDYLKVGLPLNLIFLVMTISTVYFFI